MEVKTHYDTDLTDKQWQIIKKFIPQQKQGPKQICRRRIINAIRYVVRTGCQWRNLPYDFPKCSNIFRAVYWKEPMAEAMLLLRCLYKANRWQNIEKQELVTINQPA